MSTKQIKHLTFLNLWNKLKEDYEAKKPLNVKEEPFIEEITYKIDWVYNPKYGDQRMCRCGHEYQRHFDSHEIRDVGRKNCCECGCQEFEEGISWQQIEDNDQMRKAEYFKNHEDYKDYSLDLED